MDSTAKGLMAMDPTATEPLASPDPPSPGAQASIGIVGGGQLAWMLAAAASRLGVALHVQTPAADDPAAGGHAHVEAMIYLGDRWPAEYRGSVFMSNIHGRRVNRDRLGRAGADRSRVAIISTSR